MPFKRQPAANRRCRATTKAGRQCAAPVICGGIYCALHSDPKKAAELGRKGGRANRHTYEEPLQEVAAPESPADVRRLLAQTMADVRSGKLDPKIGSTLAYIATSLLRAFEGDPPAQIIELPSIYRALRFRTTAADVRQPEEPRDAATDPTPAQTGEEEVSPRKKYEGYEIFDLP